MSSHKDPFEYWMDKQAAQVPVWEEPECYDVNNRSDRRQMYSRLVMGDAKVDRKVAHIALDLFEAEYPDEKNNAKLRERFMKPIIAEGDRYGKWHYFSWSNRLVQYADEETHWRLLANRNRELIRSDELPTLRHKTTAHVGLSVGSVIVEQLSHMAMGEKVILSDPDVLSVPNLNRINAGMPEVGMRKTDIVGIRLSELNPYVKQVHLPEGITPGNAHIVARHNPDFIFEEVDHLPTKILMRKIARQVRATLLMATDAGELSMLDVERYDLGDDRPFLDLLTRDEITMVEKSDPTYKQTVKLIEKLIEEENSSPRLALSMGQIGITLGGIAQLGTTAAVGGAYAAIAAKEVALGNGPATGRYKISPQSILRIPHM